MFFTAIAMIAFSSVSMANTIAGKNGDTPNFQKDFVQIDKSELNIKITSVDRDCGSVWSATVIYFRERGATKFEAECIAWEAYTTCVGIGDTADKGVGMEC